MSLSFYEMHYKTYYKCNRDTENMIKKNQSILLRLEEHLNLIISCREKKRTRNLEERMSLAEGLAYLCANLSKETSDPNQLIELLKKRMYLLTKPGPTQDETRQYRELQNFDQEVEDLLLCLYKKWLNVIEIFATATENNLDIYLSDLELTDNVGFLTKLRQAHYQNFSSLKLWDEFLGEFDEYNLPTIHLKKICNKIKPKNDDKAKQAKITKKQAYALIVSYIRELSEEDQRRLFFEVRSNQGSPGYKSRIEQLIKNSEDKGLFCDRSGWTNKWDDNFYSNLWDEVRRDLKSEFNN